MSSFEYITILYSIIIAVGLTDLLNMLSRQLRQEAKGGLLYFLWAVNMIFLMIQNFWATFTLNEQVDWKFIELILHLLPPITLFLIASLLCPRNSGKRNLDKYIIDKRHLIFGMIAFAILLFSLNDYLRFGGDSYRSVIRGSMFIMFCLLVYVPNRKFHLFCSILFLAVQLGFTFTWTSSLSELLENF